MKNTINKPWYKSKTIWAGVFTVLIACWDNALVPILAKNYAIILPIVPNWIYGLLGTLGIYGRVDAKKEIGK